MALLLPGAPEAKSVSVPSAGGLSIGKPRACTAVQVGYLNLKSTRPSAGLEFALLGSFPDDRISPKMGGAAGGRWVGGARCWAGCDLTGERQFEGAERPAGLRHLGYGVGWCVWCSGVSSGTFIPDQEVLLFRPLLSPLPSPAPTPLPQECPLFSSRNWALSLLEVLSSLSTELHSLGTVSVRGTELPLQPPCLPGLLSVLGALVGSLQTGASFHTCSLAAHLAPRPLRPPGPGKTTTPRGLWDVHRSPV